MSDSNDESQKLLTSTDVGSEEENEQNGYDNDMSRPRAKSKISEATIAPEIEQQLSFISEQDDIFSNSRYCSVSEYDSDQFSDSEENSFSWIRRLSKEASSEFGKGSAISRERRIGLARAPVEEECIVMETIEEDRYGSDQNSSMDEDCTITEEPVKMVMGTIGEDRYGSDQNFSMDKIFPITEEPCQRSSVMEADREDRYGPDQVLPMEDKIIADEIVADEWIQLPMEELCLQMEEEILPQIRYEQVTSVCPRRRYESDPDLAVRLVEDPSENERNSFGSVSRIDEFGRIRYEVIEDPCIAIKLEMQSEEGFMDDSTSDAEDAEERTRPYNNEQNVNNNVERMLAIEDSPINQRSEGPSSDFNRMGKKNFPDTIDGEISSTVDPNRKSLTPSKILFNLNQTVGNRALASSYLRVTNDESMESLESFVEYSWPSNWKPDLLLSFLGGSDQDFICKNAEEALREALPKVITSSDNLFFTRASHVGLSKLIGQICNGTGVFWKSGFLTHCIGIMPWSCVAKQEVLENIQMDKAVKYTIKQDHKEHLESKRVYLDHNHDKFFLVDDGMEGSFGSENRFRTRLLRHLKTKYTIPCVQILVGGGLTTIKALHDSLTDNKKANTAPIPLVIMKGSGRAADVFAYLMECDFRTRRWKDRRYKQYDNVNMMLAAKLAAIKYLDPGYIYNITNLKSLVLVRQCMEKARIKHIQSYYVCDVESVDRDLHSTILAAALGGTRHLPSYRQLRLAMELKDVERARMISKKTKKACLYPMDDSLYRCIPGMVDQILKNLDFDLELYSDYSLVQFYRSEVIKDIRQEEFVIRYFKELYLKEDKKTKYRQSEEKLKDHEICYMVDKALQTLSDMNLAAHCHGLSSSNSEINKMKINGTQAFMINSIITNRPTLTEVFWKYDKHNPLSNALLAFTLQSGISKLYGKRDKSTPRILLESNRYFEEKIINLLTCYYETDKEMTSKVLTRKIPIWRNQTIIDVAGDIELKTCIEHPASQYVLSKAWKGEDPDHESYLESLKQRAGNECCLTKLFLLFCFKMNKSLGKPSVKLYLHIMMYLLSIGMFAFNVLVKNTAVDKAIQWTMFVMILSLALDEIRQISDYRKNFGLNFKRWISSPWNILDATTIALFFIGFAASFVSLQASRTVFAIFLCFWCIKFTQFLRIISIIGPYMVMIFQMLAHMKTFLIVLMITVIGYGIFMTALLYPSDKPGWDILFKVIFRPYLLVFGELGIDSHELRRSQTVFGPKNVNRLSEMLVILGMALFLLFANVLLLNLLIAAFSSIYEEVKEKSSQIWKFEKYQLLKEFQNKPLLPFPFSIPENLCLLYWYYRNRDKKEQAAEVRNEEEERNIIDFERFCLMKSWSELSADHEEDSICSVNELQDSINKIRAEMNERIEKTKQGLFNRLDVSEYNVKKQLLGIESNVFKRLNEMENMLQRLLDNSNQNTASQR